MRRELLNTSMGRGFLTLWKKSPYCNGLCYSALAIFSGGLPKPLRTKPGFPEVPNRTVVFLTNPSIRPEGSGKRGGNSAIREGIDDLYEIILKEVYITTIYLISDHGKLSKNNELFEFIDSTGKSCKIFPHSINSFVISGIVTITGAAMRLLMKHTINTVFINRNGKYNGKLEFDAAKNIFLRKRQFLLSGDEDVSLSLVKSIVTAKIKNQLCFVQRIKRKNHNEEAFRQAIGSLKSALENTADCKNINVLRGYEGIAAKNYFSVFRYNIIPEWAQFPRRSMHPPLSNVNAVLSFLYTLLMYRVETAIEAAGLDPMLGFMHAAEYGKKALVFDLMEEFRTPVADTLCCSLFNLGILSEDDFETAEDDMLETGKGGEGAEIPIYLTQSGLTKTVAAFEKKIGNLLYYQPLKTEIPFYDIIHEQVRHFKGVIQGGETEYQGYVYK
jgi:CRISPR-associated protein Cas1